MNDMETITSVEEMTNIQQIESLLEQVPNNKRPIANSLFEQLVFINDTMEELKAEVSKNGAIELFRQGAVRYLRESPALKSYNTLVQKYCTVCKSIVALFPKQPVVVPGDDLYEFISQ